MWHPLRVALALQADGWWLRSDIVWHKPNPMPESVTDRPTKAHEYLFLLTKSARYYYDADAIREANSDPYRSNFHPGKRKFSDEMVINSGDKHRGFGRTGKDLSEYIGAGRNKRTVWTIPTKPFPKAHFATFPPALIEPCILVGTSEKGCCVECGSPWERVVEKTKSFQSGSGKSGNPIAGKQDLSASQTNSTPDVRMGPCVESKTIGWKPTCECIDRDKWKIGDKWPYKPCTVLDPFGGAMTTAITAYKHNRKFVMIELSKAYIDDIGIPRIKKAIEQLKLFT